MEESATRREIGMELTVHDESNSTLDTTKDTCLFRAERRPGQAAYTRGKDLYLHSRRGLSPLYYIHRWSLNPGEEGEYISHLTGHGQPVPRREGDPLRRPYRHSRNCHPAIVGIWHSGRVLNIHLLKYAILSPLPSPHPGARETGPLPGGRAASSIPIPQDD